MVVGAHARLKAVEELSAGVVDLREERTGAGKEAVKRSARAPAGRRRSTCLHRLAALGAGEDISVLAGGGHVCADQRVHDAVLLLRKGHKGQAADVSRCGRAATRASPWPMP